MKKIAMSLMMTLMVFCAIAQGGIQFTEGSWIEVLNQAKMQNKLVFVDVYTSWCVPCKKMAAEVFPLPDVGNLFNPTFVNYKFDAEKGEGVEIAKKYGVRSYPTYLFVDGDGKLIYRISGYMDAASFFKEANIALQEKNDPKPFVQWEMEYEKGNRDVNFLVAYMKKRELLKLPSPDIIEELIPKLSANQLLDKEILGSIYFGDTNIQFVPEGKGFNYLIHNYKKLDSLNLVKYATGILEMGINNYFQKHIIPFESEDELPQMISAYRKLLTASAVSEPEQKALEKGLVMKYYNGTNQVEKFCAAAMDYVDNGLMKTDIKGKIAADKVTYEAFMQPYLEGKADSLKDQNYMIGKRLMKHQLMTPFSYSLRDAAEYVYNQSDDPTMLKRATEWAKLANTYFPHFSSGAVYAGLLFKTGRQANAVSFMEKVCEDDFLTNAAEVKKRLQGTLGKMRKGEAPANLWR